MTGMQNIDLLFIHPEHKAYGRSTILPMGLPGLINSVSAVKLGRMHHEVSCEEIRSAKVIAMDLHWYFPLDSVKTLAEWIKSVNPEVPIVVGGYTATIFSDLLVNRTAIDYVVTGDCERPFPNLMEALLSGDSLQSIPNLVSRDFRSANCYSTHLQDYDALDYYSIEWFPTLSHLAARDQKNRYPTFIYPFIPVAKGCRVDCEGCYGNPRLQRLLTGRTYLSRSPEAVRRDIVRLDSDTRIQKVYIISDFFLFEGMEYADEALPPRTGLCCYFEFFHVPTEAALDRMLSTFEKCYLVFSSKENHNERWSDPDLGPLVERMTYAVRRGADVTLLVDVSLVASEVSYRKKIAALQGRISGLNLMNNADWKLPIPDPRRNGPDREADFYRFLRLSRTVPFRTWVTERIVSVAYRSAFLTYMIRRAHTWELRIRFLLLRLLKGMMLISI